MSDPEREHEYLQHAIGHARQALDWLLQSMNHAEQAPQDEFDADAFRDCVRRAERRIADVKAVLP